MIIELITSLGHEEDGAVTIDWVVLAAVLVGLGISIATTTGHQSVDLIENMNSEMLSLVDQY